MLPFISCRQLLLCRVALGKSFLQFSAMKMAHAPPGHHSVIGRPSAGGLHFPEYVVYRGEQVRLIIPRTVQSISTLTNTSLRLHSGIPRILGHLSNCQARRQLQRQRRIDKVMDCQRHQTRYTIVDDISQNCSDAFASLQ